MKYLCSRTSELRDYNGHEGTRTPKAKCHTEGIVPTHWFFIIPYYC